MKYLVVERGYEYNDEYNVLNADGYNIVSKLYNTKEEAKVGVREAILKQFTNSKGELDSSIYDFNQFEQWDSRMAEFFKKKGYLVDEGGCQLFLPEGLSENEILEAWEYYGISLYNIIEVQE